MRDFAGSGAIVFAGMTIANVLQYLYYVIVSRAVGVNDYGVFMALLAAATLCAGPATVGAVAIAKLAADYHAAGDAARLRRLAELVDLGACTAAVAILLLTTALWHPIAAFFHLDSIAPIAAAGVTLGLLVVLPLQRAVLQGRHRFGAFSISNIVETIVKVGLGAYAALAFGVAGALAGGAVGLLCAAVYNAVAVRNGVYVRTIALGIPLRTFSLLAAKTIAPVLSIYVLLFFDTILVRHFFDAHSAGVYAAASLVGRAIYMATGFVPIVLLPKAAERAARGANPTPLLLTGGLAVACCGAVGLVACAALPQAVVRAIAGPGYLEASSIVLPYAVASVALAGANAIANYKIGLDRFDHAVPLVIVASGEVIGVVFHHQQLRDVVTVVVFGNLCALLVTLFAVRVFRRD